jgi:hypothetical protein
MENASTSPFLVFWNNAMIVGGAIMLLGGIAIYIVHKVRAASISDPKAKYDYLNAHEIKNYKYVFLCFGISATLLINLYGGSKLNELGVWFFVRLFMSIAGGTLVAYVSYLILDYYYPTILNTKLRKWRYMPRESSAGRKMRLLGEEEEDVHLEEGMQAEESVFSIDYDVWIDEVSGDVKIEKYPGQLQALKCNSCGFYTMRVVREEINAQPTESSPGELIKHYQCKYCKSIRATAFNISNRDPEDYKSIALTANFKKKKDIDLVRIEIHSNVAGKKFFEFQTAEQARRFLQEYEDKSG